jgi:hypothetical protein
MMGLNHKKNLCHFYPIELNALPVKQNIVFASRKLSSVNGGTVR